MINDSHMHILETSLLGRSPAIQKARQQILNAARVEVPVLLSGESGTGKDVAAQMLHELGPRRNRRFVKVNCPAIPQQLFESELFGYEAGAFTGAKQARPGKLEQANDGTIFLDEIGDLDISLQSKLLQALQDFRFFRLGGVEDRTVNVRLICGTNRNLTHEVEQGRFRADLFYRINVIQILMPPLRDRLEDVPIMMEHFIRDYSDEFGRVPTDLSPSLMHVLAGYHWPGNVRELKNLAKRYVVLGGEEHILSALRERPETNPFLLESVDLNTPLRIQTKRAVRMLERRIILSVLQAHKWNRRKTARSLDISYRALLYKIKEAGVSSIRPNGSKAKASHAPTDLPTEAPVPPASVPSTLALEEKFNA
jgi:transcriptional regulator with PAS, ATPase and Fis domain